jgi:hypothetical protein
MFLESFFLGGFADFGIIHNLSVNLLGSCNAPLLEPLDDADSLKTFDVRKKSV